MHTHIIRVIDDMPYWQVADTLPRKFERAVNYHKKSGLFYTMITVVNLVVLLTPGIWYAVASGDILYVFLGLMIYLYILFTHLIIEEGQKDLRSDIVYGEFPQYLLASSSPIYQAIMAPAFVEKLQYHASHVTPSDRMDLESYWMEATAREKQFTDVKRKLEKVEYTREKNQLDYDLTLIAQSFASMFESEELKASFGSFFEDRLKALDQEFHDGMVAVITNLGEKLKAARAPMVRRSS